MAVPEPMRDGQIVDGKVQLSTALWDTYLEMPPPQDAKEVDARDANTPDKCICRHPAMQRNTGMHPFNAEPPMQKLQDAGWITPASLLVVRQHGAVPQLKWSEHKLKIRGVPQPCELSMDQIASGDFGSVVSFPVTFICAGNRRKEQNMTKKTVGFDWGPAAVGNSVWTGVRLCDVLAHVGITRPTKEGILCGCSASECRYVHFEGPLGELPQGETRSWGTSIDIGWALDRERDVILAFKQNGELLTPDHGAPLRTILPGCIGGRMVKWLSSMWVSDHPSENHYHYFDNRVLPPHVDVDLAYAEGWWYKPEYVINHMNINSAMFEPWHNSFVTLGQESTPSTVKVSGYAYTGGGHKIIRAEISLDSGKCWELTNLTRPEDDIAAARGTDKHWCWSWWETEVELQRLEGAEEICCRAWDSNHNSQPVQLTWTVMGMLHNAIYRIKIHREKSSHGQDMIWFEHPTQGSNPGGWMTDTAGQFNESVASPATPGPKGVSSLRPPAAVWTGAKQKSVRAEGAKEAGKFVKSSADWLTTGVPMSEVKKHDNEKSCWFVVQNKVYDGTSYLEDHPGGASSMLLAAGLEATGDFEAVHSSRAWGMLENYYVGPLKQELVKPGDLLLKLPSIAMSFTWRQVFGAFGLFFGAAASALRQAIVPAVFLSQKETRQLQLSEKITVSHDTRIFRFALPSKSTRLGLPTGMHVILKARVDGKPLMRAYTPVTDDSTPGHVDLLVKVYFKDVHPEFPEGGKMSQHMESMKIGDAIEVKGPVGDFVYKGRGRFTWRGQPGFCKEISMIAGGTGLTPCWQVLLAIMRDPKDSTKVRLLYASKSPGDILAREMLEKLAAENTQRFSLHLTVDRVDGGEQWKGHVGHVNAEMAKASLFKAGQETICAMCGPPVMLEKACHPALAEMGYSKKNIFEF
eukprot:s4047_g9.t3